jgi:predicted DNA-binding antitoxin AbrB/MazE fold protein
MTRVDAIYEHGIFRLLGPVDLPENQRVALNIEPVSYEDIMAWLAETDRLREEIAAEHGILPDSAIDIAEDRRRET